MTHQIFIFEKDIFDYINKKLERIIQLSFLHFQFILLFILFI